jgi:survival-of-motor-neuron-related-splicing factor 30
MVQMIDESLAELKPKQQPAPRPAAPRAASPPPQPPAQQEKWSRENHPAFKKPAAPTEEEEKKAVDEAPVIYQVNDTVMAKWMSGDKGFYPARITAVTGSSTKPIYTVKFKSYDNIETLGARDIRPVHGAAGQKRKVEEVSSQPAPVTSADGAVLAAPASLYPQEKKEGEEKPVKKFKKIKANKELEAGKNKWQEFNAKAMGKGKAVKGAKKESMFRTPDGVGGRGTFSLLLC